MQQNILSKNFSTKDVVKYVIPTILMMLSMSTYTIVDGIFVANLVGEDALSAVNLIYPVLGVIVAIGLMLGTGGVAVIGKFMGENQYDKARGFLTTIYIIGIGLGIAFTVGGYVFSDILVGALAKDAVLATFANAYLLSMLPFTVTMILQVYVQTFFVTAGKPMLGFLVSVLGGVTNVILDYIFISPKFFDMGIAGAGLATGIGNAVPGIFGLIYFMVCRKGTLYFAKPFMQAKVILQSLYNGSSEMVSNLSASVTTVMFNTIMLDQVGKSGVAAISVILYVQMFQMAFYMGYSMGIAPVLSYKHGAKDYDQLSKIVKISLKSMMAVSVVVVTASLIFSKYAVAIFISPTSETFAFAEEGFRIFSISYLFMGVNIFLSAMFTAFSNGKMSATLSVLRTLVFMVIALLILPEILGVFGVWIAVPIAEILTLCVGGYYFKKYKNTYHY